MTHQEYMDCPFWALELLRAYENSKGGDAP